MKRLAIFLGCVALVSISIGCDETTLQNLPADVQAAVSSYLVGKTTMSARPMIPGTQDQLRDRDRDQLHDGTCDNDGNQYGGLNNPGNNGGNGTGDGSGDQDRLHNRDGSCGD